MKDKLLPILALLLFAEIGIILWQAFGKIFYLFNFIYIGTFLSLGIFLLRKKHRYARQIVQLGVGLYMLVGLGVLGRENMQIEGFWFYLFSGLFQAAVIHYLVAKLAGPLLFGRGWCGWACWTAAVLDFLPYKRPKAPRPRKLGFIRYLLFALSLIFVGALFVLKIENIEQIMFVSFIVGNILYYIVGIVLAFAFRDNRAFCKYICPVTVFLKPASYFSLLRIKPDTSLCIKCGACERACPMGVEILNEKRSRKNGTECILCYECSKVCPKDAL